VSIVDHNCDLFIAGETDNYATRFAIDSGVDLIETGHEISENPGLKHFSKMLQNEFKNIEVVFYENKSPWELL